MEKPTRTYGSAFFVGEKSDNIGSKELLGNKNVIIQAIGLMVIVVLGFFNFLNIFVIVEFCGRVARKL